MIRPLRRGVARARPMPSPFRQIAKAAALTLMRMTEIRMPRRIQPRARSARCAGAPRVAACLKNFHFHTQEGAEGSSRVLRRCARSKSSRVHACVLENRWMAPEETRTSEGTARSILRLTTR